MKTPGVNMPEAPDQNPPLDFIMDLATFAQPTVPVLGLILLGANLSRLSMKGLPKGFWKSAVLMAVLKLIVGKIYGFSTFSFCNSWFPPVYWYIGIWDEVCVGGLGRGAMRSPEMADLGIVPESLTSLSSPE